MYVINKTLLIGQDKILHKVCLHTERALSKRWFNLRKFFSMAILAKKLTFSLQNSDLVHYFEETTNVKFIPYFCLLVFWSL